MVDCTNYCCIDDGVGGDIPMISEAIAALKAIDAIPAAEESGPDS